MKDLDVIVVGYIDSDSKKNPSWYNLLTEREIREVEFARLYAKEFNHGTDGHNRLVLITKLVDILNQSYLPPLK